MDARDVVRRPVEVAADLLGLEPEVRTRLASPNAVLEVSVPVRMDDGSVRVFRVWRSQYQNARGRGVLVVPDVLANAGA